MSATKTAPDLPPSVVSAAKVYLLSLMHPLDGPAVRRRAKAALATELRKAGMRADKITIDQIVNTL